MRKLGQVGIFVGVTAWLTPALAADALRAQQTEQVSPAAPKSHYRMALARRQYLCDGGARVVVLLERNAVRLNFNGQIHNLKQIESGSNSKYSDGLLVWSVSGDFASLEDVSVRDKTKELAEGCVLESSYPPPAPAPGTVTGTIRYPESLDLPPEAEVIVELKDYALAGNLHPTIATYTAHVGNAGRPIAFKVSADPSKIDTTHQYALEIRIVLGGEVKAANDVPYLVLTQGHPANADVVLVATGVPKVRKD